MVEVILAHGLWVPGALMRPLAARLEGAGFRCHTFSYLGTAHTMEDHTERLARFARARAQGTRWTTRKLMLASDLFWR